MSELYLPRFQRMVAELGEHPHVTVKDFDIPAPATRDEIEAAKRLAGGSLPAGLEEFYSELNGFSLEWEHTLEEARQGDDGDTGSVDILPLRKVFREWRDTFWFDSFEGGDRYKGVKPLDFFAPEACSALYRPADDAPFERTIHYHYLGEFLCDTGYTFAEYADRLLASRGSWYWMETLCQDTLDSPQARDFFRRMPLLFPDFDPSLFRPGPA